MKRLLAALLLAAAGTAHAALPSVVLETPLSPGAAPAALGAAGAGAILVAPPAALTAPLALTSFAAPSLSAAPLQAAPAAILPALAPSVVAADLPALAAPAASAPAAARPAGPRAVDALIANAPLADALSAGLNSGSLEEAAPAFARNFAAAASLGTDADGKGDATPAAGVTPAAPHDALMARLLQRVTLDDGGVPERRAALTRAFARMMKSATAREYAERFIADGATAVVRFKPFEGSRLYETDGRRIFYAPRAFTEWKDGHVEVRMNLDYLGADEGFQDQDLPPTVAHELFGHGLWYSRAARENVFQAFHHHELNETNARLVGWLTDFELDGRFEESGAWSYLHDPAAFLSYLKLRLPYYALTFSHAELTRPIEALAARSSDAKAKRARLETELANHNSWNAVIDHFVAHHGLQESRLRALRAGMADTAQTYKDELAMMDSLIAEVDGTVGRMKAEDDRVSERYLQGAAAHALFADLQNEADANARRLLDQVNRAGARPEAESPEGARLRAEHWRGQLTFDELVEMYRRDRAENPTHWR